MRDEDRITAQAQPEPSAQLEPWMRGIIPGVHPVMGHLIRSVEQIREDAETALSNLTPAQVWAKPHGMTSAGFHAKHLAGSVERLSAYLAGRQLTEEQLAAIGKEGEGVETAAELLALVDTALRGYENVVSALSPQDFDAVREVGRKRYRTTAIGVAIHTAEHAQRHIGGLIAAAKLARAASIADTP